MSTKNIEQSTNISELLRETRNAKGMTFAAAGKKLSVSGSYVRQIEEGIKVPSARLERDILNWVHGHETLCTDAEGVGVAIPPKLMGLVAIASDFSDDELAELYMAAGTVRTKRLPKQQPSSTLVANGE